MDERGERSDSLSRIGLIGLLAIIAMLLIIVDSHTNQLRDLQRRVAILEQERK